MEYAVIRHGNMDSVVVFMKALDDGAVYFKNKAGTRQWIINLPTSNGRGGDIAFELRKQLRAKGLTAQADEINKAAQSLLSVIKHTDESSDDEIIIDEGVEIIDAPYPEHGKAQIPRRCFIYDDEDGYPEGYEGYIEHHGILGMKWGVRRYQNADGSLTEAGKKHYDKVSSSSMQSKLDTSDALRISKKTSSYQAAKEKSSTEKADKYKKKADSEFDPIKKDKYLSKSKAAEKEAEAARKIKEEYSKLYKDISEGSVKAGKDFVIQRDIEAHLLMPVSYIDYYKTLENHPDQEYQLNPWIGGIRRTIVKKK